MPAAPKETPMKIGEKNPSWDSNARQPEDQRTYDDIRCTFSNLSLEKWGNALSPRSLKILKGLSISHAIHFDNASYRTDGLH